MTLNLQYRKGIFATIDWRRLHYDITKDSEVIHVTLTVFSTWTYDNIECTRVSNVLALYGPFASFTQPVCVLHTL